MAENEIVYEYENENNLSPEEMEQLVEAERRQEAMNKLKPFLKRRLPRVNKKVATRRAAALAARNAQRKAAEVGLNSARATAQYNALSANINVEPLNQESLAQLDPEVAVSEMQMHEAQVNSLKQAAQNQYRQASLGNLRTNTNASFANFSRKVPTLPPAVRPTFIMLAKMDDVYGKLTRNLAIANTEAERRAIASKRYNVDKVRTLLNKVITKQSNDPTYNPPALQRIVNALSEGENINAVLAPNTTSVSSRIPQVIANFQAAQEARYATLRGQMNTLPSESREKISFLAALEEAIQIVRAQPVANNTAEQAINAELANLNGLRTVVEAAIAGNTVIPLQDKVKILSAIQSYRIGKSRENSLYKRLEQNRTTFNQRNMNAAAAAAAAQMIPLAAMPAAAAALPPPPPTAQQKANARAARLARFAGKGGTARKQRKQRKTRKN
jgi:hypothetical protein